MFRGIINDATTAANALAGRLAARASVLVPFMIAVGFAVAALTLTLVDIFGARDAYLIVAAGFAVIGLIALVAVRSSEQSAAPLELKSTETETADMAADTVTAAAEQVPLALVMSLLSGPGGPTAALSALRMMRKNWALVALAAGIGGLLFLDRDRKPAAPSYPADASATSPDAMGDPVAASASRRRANGAYRAEDAHA